MQGKEIRKAFLEYFSGKGHTVVRSSSLIPSNDPTLLFTNAGMVQFKDCFLGSDRRDYTRAATCQKVLRISGKHNDLENVGVTARHHTFFEMLGNFSFGDYFKEDAIKYAWEFVTSILGLPKGRLWVSVFEKDDEAANLWEKAAGVSKDRILRLGEKDNFWAMGETGPCGPCSEIYYYLGKDESKQSEEDFRRDDGTYLEIWNLVFMQFERDLSGKLTPLPKPSIDTGMGLERITSVMQNENAAYHTDLVRPVITLCEKLTGFKYDGSSFVERDLKSDIPYARDVAMRVIADHSRSIACLIADGVLPGSDGRGYVLRRLIRRAIRHGRVLEFSEPFLAKAVEEVIKTLSDPYTELLERKDVILRVADAEERKFHETLDAGLGILKKEISSLKPGALLSGEAAFLLHDTYGFPLDLTEDALKPYNIKVDHPGFEEAMKNQRERSREERRSHGFTYTAAKFSGPKTKFLGYRDSSSEGKITDVLGDQATFNEGDRVLLCVDATPFYAESGGQVGDTGEIRTKDALLKVLDTQKVMDGYFVHECEIRSGNFSKSIVGEKAWLEVDSARRDKIKSNHSATHLVHSALREVLGTHVKQAGSRVDDGTLRFDYSHFEPVSEKQLEYIQSIINEQVRMDHEVVTREMPIDAAKKLGAMALFGEKYGDVVRVVEIGPKSLELCGGTHVSRSGNIGFVSVMTETGIASGVRRIECVSGVGANNEMLRMRRDLLHAAGMLKSDSASFHEKLERVLDRSRMLEKELESLKAKVASSSAEDLLKDAVVSRSGIKVVAHSVGSADIDTLKAMVDSLRVKLGSGVVVLSGVGSGQDRASIVVGVTQDLTKTVNAGAIVKEIVQIAGGKGGGRPDFAQAGGLDPAKVGESLAKVPAVI